jgi:FG-GAP-like repeat
LIGLLIVGWSRPLQAGCEIPSFGFPAVFGEAGNPVSADPQVLAAGDFNGDNSIDFVIATTQDSITVWIGNGQGAFSRQKQIFLKELASFTGGFGDAVVGDFNNDGKKDVALTADGYIFVLLGTGNENIFNDPAAYSALIGLPPFNVSRLKSINSLAVGDVDGDGNSDLIAVVVAAGVVPFMGDGSGHFAAFKDPRV